MGIDEPETENDRTPRDSEPNTQKRTSPLSAPRVLRQFYYGRDTPLHACGVPRASPHGVSFQLGFRLALFSMAGLCYFARSMLIFQALPPLVFICHTLLAYALPLCSSTPLPRPARRYSILRSRASSALQPPQATSTSVTDPRIFT